MRRFLFWFLICCGIGSMALGLALLPPAHVQAQDGGSPALDEDGLPFEDEGPRVDEDGLPIEDEGPRVDEDGLPIEGEAPQVDGDGLPVEDEAAAAQDEPSAEATEEAGPSARENPQQDAGYEGARRCARCHGDMADTHELSAHALTLREADDDVILGDFEQGEDIRAVTFPDDDEPTPFDARDVEYVIGLGRNVQAYLYEIERNTLMVFPAVWNVRSESWQPYTLAESWPDDAYLFGPNCSYCHTTGLEVDLEDADYEWSEDGVQCEACHGPGSVHVEVAGDAGRRPDEEELAQVRGSIYRGPDPQMCGQCHSQGEEPGNGHPFPLNFIPGEDLLAPDQFALVPEDAPDHWWATGHASAPWMQFNEWLTSAHADSANAVKESERAEPMCLGCHSGDAIDVRRQAERVEEGDRLGEPPESLTVEQAQFGVLCTTCHEPHAAGIEAEPTLREETYPLCASCHSMPEEFIHATARNMFEGHAIVDEVEPVPSAHYAEEDGPRCATCHQQLVPTVFGERNSHALQIIMPGAAAAADMPLDSCTTCHDDADRGSMQRIIDDTQAGMQARLEAIRGAMTDAGPEWVTRAVRFVEADGSRGIHNFVYTDQLLRAAEVELGLVPAVAPPPDINELVRVALPESEIAALAQEPDAEVGTRGETRDREFVARDTQTSFPLQSAALLVIGAAVLVVAAYAFFIRRSE